MLRPLKAMEPAVRQYESVSPLLSVSWLKKAGVFIVVGCSWFVLHRAGSSLFHWPQESLDRLLFTSVLFGAIFVLFQFSYGRPQRLMIGQDFIEARTQIYSFRFKKRIRREQIKSISENKRGLYVRDRGKIAARILGLIFIPRSTFEYKEIRSELAQWAPINVKS